MTLSEWSYTAMVVAAVLTMPAGLIVDGKLYSGEWVIVEPDGEKEVILRGA